MKMRKGRARRRALRFCDEKQVRILYGSVCRQNKTALIFMNAGIDLENQIATQRSGWNLKVRSSGASASMIFAKKSSQAMQSLRRTGRGDRIRTCGLFVPNEALYQAEPHLDVLLLSFVTASLVYRSMREMSTGKTKKIKIFFLATNTGQRCGT